MLARKLTLVLLLCLTGCATRETTVRVLSYNIRHGDGMDRKIDIPRIADVIRSTNPDLVALQEVDRGVQRSARMDEPAKLGELTGMQPVFEKNITFQGGEYGNAVLSRLPIQRWQNHHLPQSVPDEQRGLLEVHISPAGELVFCATHLSYHPEEGERLASAEMFREMSSKWGDTPFILCGDFNASPESETLKKFGAFMLDSCPASLKALTFPADKPDRRIDYILYSHSPRIRCLSYTVVNEPLASDHRPILAVFAVRG